MYLNGGCAAGSYRITFFKEHSMSKMDPSLKKRLAALQDLWAAGASAPKRGFQELADGEYKGKIVAAELAESKAGRNQVVWTLKVTAGPSKGQTVKRFSGLATEENMAWLAGDLQTLGIEFDADDVESLIVALGEAVDLDIVLKVRHKDEYTNIDFVDVSKNGNVADAKDAKEEPKGNKKGKAKDEEEEEDSPSDADDGTPTKASIKLMKGKTLRTLAADLDIDPDDFDDDDKKIQAAVIKELGL
jgi:hypothetical protein